MNNKPINIYKDTFKKISKIEKHEIYKKTKKEIKHICQNSKNYSSIEYIDLEIERVEYNIEKLKSPFLSIFYAIILVVIPILVSVIKDLVGKLINVDFNNMNDSTKFLLFFYIISAALLFYVDMLNKENEFGCYFIYRTILKELRDEINVINKNVINEVAITSEKSKLDEKSIIIKIEKDIKDIRKFMGMKY